MTDQSIDSSLPIHKYTPIKNSIVMEYADDNISKILNKIKKPGELIKMIT